MSFFFSEGTVKRIITQHNSTKHSIPAAGYRLSRGCSLFKARFLQFTADMQIIRNVFCFFARTGSANSNAGQAYYIELSIYIKFMLHNSFVHHVLSRVLTFSPVFPFGRRSTLGDHGIDRSIFLMFCCRPTRRPVRRSCSRHHRLVTTAWQTSPVLRCVFLPFDRV